MAGRTKAPEPDGCPLTDEDLAACEEALRQLQAPKATIAWCERCNIPVDAIKRDYEDLERFFTGILANSRGPQSSHTGHP